MLKGKTRNEKAPARFERRCADYDGECSEVECKVGCWLYDPTRGLCPFLYPVDREQ